MPHQVSDLIEVSFRGHCEQQTILNIFHYRVVSSSSVSSDVADNFTLAAYLAGQTAEGQVLKEYLDLLPTNYTLDKVRVQKILTTRSQYAEATSGVLGFWPALSNNTNLAAVLTKQGSTGTRRAIGSIHIGPISETAQDRGRVNAAYKTDLESFGTVWRTPFTVPANNINYRLVIYNPNVIPYYQDVSALVIQDTVRTMRRRTVGLGI